MSSRPSRTRTPSAKCVEEENRKRKVVEDAAAGVVRKKARADKIKGAATKVTKGTVKKDLMKLAAKFEEGQGCTAVISYDEAHQLWRAASDGPGVTQNEYFTMAKILDEFKFTKKARIYLDSLVTKHCSGTSMYKTVAGVKYDRSCLDLADFLYKDNKIDLADAKLLWIDVEDGNVVTEVEKRTIEYVRDNMTHTDGAKNFFKEKLDAWVAPVRKAPPAPEPVPSARRSRAPRSPQRARTSTPSTNSFSFGNASGFGSSGSSWHGSSGFSASSYAGNVVSKDFEFNMQGKAYGLFVDDEFCYAGDETGSVSKVKLDGTLDTQYRLPAGVKCMVGDNGFLFAGCNNGSLYDLTAGAPRLVAELDEFKEVLWLDIHNGAMAASDADGNVAIVNCEGETIWKKKSNGDAGWMCRIDESGVYHGHSKGVTKYSHTGDQLWHCQTEGVLFGWLHGDHVYAGLVEPNCFDGEIAKRLKRAGAKTGEVVFSLMWNNTDDLDLHVYTPGGAHIFYGQKRASCGGELDVDMNAGGNPSTDPVENVYWAKAPLGEYRVSVVQYNNRSGDAVVPFELHVNVRGETQKFESKFERSTAGGRNEQTVHTFTLEAKESSSEEEKDVQEKAAVRINKSTGALETVFKTNSSVPSTTVSPAGLLYAAVPQAVKCFKTDGDGSASDWELGTGVGSAMTMQAAAGDKLFAVCGQKLVCMDVSVAAITAAQAGNAAQARQLARGADVAEVSAVSSANDLELAADASGGVVVTCFKQGSKLRVRPEAGQAGFDSSRNTQFPRDIRAEGARFVVDGLVLCGSFYRVQGNIRRLS